MDTRWTNFAFGIDVSRYQQRLDKNALAGNIDFLIAKVGQYNWQADFKDLGAHVDSMFASHVQTAADLGVACGAYWYFDPTVPQDPIYPLKDRQIQMLQYALSGKRVHFLSIDAEMTKDPNAPERTITNYQISTTTRQFANRVKALYPNLRVIIYTGNWYVNDYAPDMKVWLDSEKWEVWLATYPMDADAKPGINAASWADFRGRFAPEWPENKSFPWISNQVCKIWQFSGDKYTAPGVYGDKVLPKLSAVDVNYFNGPKAEFYKWCGFTPGSVTPDPVIPDPTPTTTVGALRERFNDLLDEAGIK
jgi:GH25 family lysozyme M1 (1,4-beta-N-acetylmuramidase)